MATKTIKADKTRFDTRLTKEQKQFFERAAAIGGFRSLTDFVILTVQEKAREIIRDEESIVASQKDSEIFFDAIVNAGKPNEELISAVKQFNKKLSE
jgi:uncharacterized protein (DUF1778 family)